MYVCMYACWHVNLLLTVLVPRTVCHSCYPPPTHAMLAQKPSNNSTPGELAGDFVRLLLFQHTDARIPVRLVPALCCDRRFGKRCSKPPPILWQPSASPPLSVCGRRADKRIPSPPLQRQDCVRSSACLLYTSPSPRDRG